MILLTLYQFGALFITEYPPPRIAELIPDLSDIKTGFKRGDRGGGGGGGIQFFLSIKIDLETFFSILIYLLIG